MEYRDYYATLGVPRTASQADIKKAFRKLARTLHPDVNTEDVRAEARFKEVNEAYDVLRDPEKRKLYDQLGANWEAYQRAGAGAGGGGFPGAAGAAGGPFAGAGGFPGGVRFEYHGDPEDLAGFSDFFRTFFAGGTGGAATERREPAGRRRPRHGAGAAPGGTGTLEEMLAGLGASRGAPGAGGRVRRPPVEASVQASLEDVATGTAALVQVGGKRLEVTVPAGIGDGQRIRLSGKGGSGPDAADLVLTVQVRPHPVFNRSGADLTRELPISLAEALLGADVPVGTISGRTLLLTVPPGTQNGRTFRLRGHGLPRFKADGHGDLLVRTRVVLPPALDEEGRHLARALSDHVRQPNPRDAHGEPTDKP